MRRHLGEYGRWIVHRPKFGHALEVPRSDELVRQGWHFWSQRTRTGCERAIDCFKRAISESPSDFRAFEGLSASYLTLAIFGMRCPLEMYPRFLEAHEQAAASSGLRPELRCNRAFGLYVFEQRRVESEAEFLQTLKEKPSLGSAYVRLGMLYGALGRFDEALAILRRGKRADPLLPTLAAAKCWCCAGSEISTRPQRSAVRVSSCIRICRSFAPTTRRRFRWAADSTRRSPNTKWHRSSRPTPVAARARRRVSGHAGSSPGCARDAGGARGAEANECVDAYYMAVFRSALGQPREALAELERAHAENSASLYMLDVDPKLDALRTEPSSAVCAAGAAARKRHHPFCRCAEPDPMLMSADVRAMCNGRFVIRNGGLNATNVLAGLLGVLVPLGIAARIAAQETRGNISGTVRDAQGVVPGAMVAVTNVDTQVSQNLVTNDSGYFEAPLLNPGNYSVTVQMTGFRTATRTNIVLGVGQQLTVPFMLEVGAITEEVLVRAETPLLDTTSLSSGANFDSRLVESLPMFSNMPITLSRFSPGLNVNDAQTQVSQGYVDNTSLSAGSGSVCHSAARKPFPPTFGGNNYTLDGANNNGSSRRIAASPNSDMIQEMRVESANFDASVGHGLGLQISMMTRAGTNRQRGTVNYPVLDEQAECADRAAEGDLRRPREERVREGAVAQRVADLRRSRADSGTRRRPRQTVLLRELLAGQRCDREDPRVAHHPGQREAPAG